MALSSRRSRARFALHTFSRIQNVAGHKQCSGLIGRINQVLSLIAILISKAQLGRLQGPGSRGEDCGICEGRGGGQVKQRLPMKEARSWVESQLGRLSQSARKITVSGGDSPDNESYRCLHLLCPRTHMTIYCTY